MSRTQREQFDLLREYSPCDVSDALLKLQKREAGKVARGGYLADLIPFAPNSPFVPNDGSQPKIIGKVSTLKMINQSDQFERLPSDDPHAIPKGSHWADETESDTVLVIEQPPTQFCAAVGGIMAARMKARGLHGVVVSGRVRDLAELKSSGLPIWAHGKSTVGTGAEAEVYARNIDIDVNGVTVSPGDIVFCDPVEGVVVIPQNLVNQVIDMIPKAAAADDLLRSDVENGSSVVAAIKKHRS